jgi:hypothetical protein
MTQPDEIPGQPAPSQPAEPVQPAQYSAVPDPIESAPQSASVPQPDYFPAVAGQAPLPGPGPEAEPEPDPYSEELAAAAAAKKARRRGIFAKSAVLAVPALVLVALLVATGLQASDLSNKTAAASTAAEAATAADALAGQLHAAESAAEASILVDAGCVAVESEPMQQVENKLVADGNSLDKASAGTSFSAFATAANHYINDLQTFSTDLQQDAALSKRASVTTAVGSVTSDLKVVISTMQDLLGGEFSDSVMSKFNAAANRMDGDATAVDAMCGGSTLNGSSGSSVGSGSGNVSA